MERNVGTARRGCGKEREGLSVPLLWRNGKMKEMADPEGQVQKVVNTSAWERQNTR